MIFIERLYNLKKDIYKFWKMYFTIEGTYTSLLPDRIYLKKLYKKRMGEKLNLKSPTTFNEKLNWLKLYDRQPEYTMMVDKYKVREYVEEKVGKEYLIPLIGCWNQVNEIDFDILPQQFVLKCNHDNGVVICKNKENIDRSHIKEMLQFHLERDYYKKAREWPYKNVERKIICEKYMVDNTNNTSDLIDYKFFCFNGEVKTICIIKNRTRDTTIDYVDTNFEYLSIVDKYPNSTSKIKKPKCFEEMLLIAQKLSAGIPYVRVDLYCINDKPYFGEMTFYDDAGFGCKEPIYWEKQFGDWIELPTKKKWRTR